MQHIPLKTELIKRRTAEYFADCDATAERVSLKSGLTSIRQIPYTLAGLAEALGVDKRAILQFCQGGPDGSKKAILCGALRRIERYTVERLLMGELTGSAASLLLKDLGIGASEQTEDGGRIQIVMDDPQGWGD